MSAKADGCPARVVEKVIPLLDFAGPCIMPQGRDGPRLVKSMFGFFRKADELMNQLITENPVGGVICHTVLLDAGVDIVVIQQIRIVAEGCF